MTSISKAWEKARREAPPGERTEIESPNVVSLGTARLARPGVDVRPNLRVARFDPEEHLVTLLAPESVESEHYQPLRFAIERMHEPGRARVIGLTSGAAKDGKTLTTLNLAGALGHDQNARVLVVDADLRSPSISQSLGLIPSGSGLSGALERGPAYLENLCCWNPETNVAVLAGTAPETAPYEVFKSLEVQSILEQARGLFDFVLVDMPPLVFPEVQVVNELVDGMLLVIAAHRTLRSDLVRGIDGIDSSRFVGIVFNRDTEQKRRMTGYYRYRRA